MPQPSKLILSTVSAWGLGDHFDETKAKKNEALREAKIAKQDGDLSENAPYQMAKEKFRTMGRIQRRLTREMDYLLARGHRLVDPLDWTQGEIPTDVQIGVVVKIEQNGDEREVLIAGARDNHIPEEGELLPIPYTSPLGTVLYERRLGASFSAEINKRVQKIVIKAIRRPTEEEILLVFPKLREM